MSHQTPEENPECKRCGLLKSTVEATNAKCIPDRRMGTTLEGVHDFPHQPQVSGEKPSWEIALEALGYLYGDSDYKEIIKKIYEDMAERERVKTKSQRRRDRKTRRLRR